MRFKIAGKGREVRGFTAYAAMLCPGVVAGQFTTQIGTAAQQRLRIAPDGSFVGALTSRAGTTMRVLGRLKGRRVTGGRVELSVGNCVGGSSFSASRSGP